MNFLRSSYKGKRSLFQSGSPAQETCSPKKSSATPSKQIDSPGKRNATLSKSRKNTGSKISGRVQWTDEMDNALVDALVEQVNLGRKSDVGFKPEAYRATITEISTKCGVLLENKHISNRLRTLKRFYWEIQDMLSASGFGWDSHTKMVIATEEVWARYISSHPFAEKVRGKHIDRYSDLARMFGSDYTHGSFASTAYSSPLSGRRRSRNEFDSDYESVRLSSYSGDDHDSGSAFRAIDGSQRLNSGRTIPVETSRGSRSTNSTAAGYSRPKRGKPSDVIGDRMGEVAEAVKSLNITMSQGKTMTRVQRMLVILEELDGLSPEDQIRATRLMQGDVVSAGYFLKMGHERRKEWVQKLLERSGPV